MISILIQSRVFYARWVGAQTLISSRKTILGKRLELFLQNLVLIILLVDFNTGFPKDQGSFAIFCHPSPHHQGLRMNGFLNNSSPSIFSDSTMRQNYVILLIKFLLSKITCHPTKELRDSGTSKVLQENSAFLQSLRILCVGQHLSYIILKGF